MKMSKRLLAVMMVVVMALTLVPLGMFAFAEEEPVKNSHDIASLADLKKIGKESDWDLIDDYTMTSDIILKTAEEKLEENYDATDAGLKLEINPVYEPATSYVSGTKYFSKTSLDPDPAVYTPVELVDIGNVTNYYVISSCDSIPYADLTDQQKTTLINKYGYQSDDNTFTMIDGDFTGVFDGDGHTISGLKIASTGYKVALFNKNSGVIKDLTFDDKCEVSLTSITGAFNAAASFVITNDGKLQNLTSNATITVINKVNLLYTYVGGIATINGDSYTKVTENKEADFNNNLYYIKTDDGYVPAVPGVDTYDKDGTYYVLNATTVELSSCAFGGDIICKCADGTFSDTKKLSDIDSRSYRVGGIAAISAASITGAYSGTITSEFVGGANQSFYTITANGVVSGSPVDTVQTITTENKTVTDINAASSIVGTGDPTFGTPNDEGYQLVTTPTTNGPVYYIRKVVCDHNKEAHPATAATCTTAGNNAYWYCTKCEKYFSDEECTKVIKKDSWIIKATGHNWTSWGATTPATYEAPGVQERTCETCHEKETRSIPQLVPSISVKSSARGYKINNGILCVPMPDTKAGVNATTIGNNLSGLQSGYSYVFNCKSSSVVGTGDKVYVSNHPETTISIAVRGDASGNGTIGIEDYIAIRKHIMGTAPIASGTVTFVGADADANGKVGISDYIAIRKLIMK